MKIELQQVLQTLLWSLITGLVFAVFKAVFDRTIVKDLKSADLIEENLRKDVEENRQLITRLYQEMATIKSEQKLNEQAFRLELQQLKQQYMDMRTDMRCQFDDLKQLIKDQLKAKS